MSIKPIDCNYVNKPSTHRINDHKLSAFKSRSSNIFSVGIAKAQLKKTNIDTITMKRFELRMNFDYFRWKFP